MGRKRWTEEEAGRVRGLLTQFNGADEVCAVMGCARAELDGLCRAAFGLAFQDAERRFAAQGRALVREAQFKAALEGDRSMLQLLGREQLGQDAMTVRRNNAPGQPGKSEVKVTTLELIKSRAGGQPVPEDSGGARAG